VALYESLGDQVAQCVQAGPVQVVTGDCLAAVGALVGLQRGGFDPSIVWFHPYGDLHTVESSASGYLGGLPLRTAFGGDFPLLGKPLDLRAIPESRALLLDARDLDPAEEEYLANSQLAHTTVEEVSASDMPDGPILLHVDVDVIDSDEVPGLRFPAANGPTVSQVVAAAHRLISSGRSSRTRSHVPGSNQQVNKTSNDVATYSPRCFRPTSPNASQRFRTPTDASGRRQTSGPLTNDAEGRAAELLLLILS
jgi:arginase